MRYVCQVPISHPISTNLKQYSDPASPESVANVSATPQKPNTIVGGNGCFAIEIGCAGRKRTSVLHMSGFGQL